MDKHEHPPRAGVSHQKTRFAPSSFSSAWEKVKKHLTPPSHPSTTSESAIDSSFNHTDQFYLESEHGRVSGPTLDLLNPLAGTSSRHKKRNEIRRRGPKSSAANSTSRYGDDDECNMNPSEPFAHTVVENDFEHFVPPAAKSESGSTNPGIGKNSGTGFFSRSSKDDEGEEENQGRTSDVGSIRRDRRPNWVRRTKTYELLVERLWPNIKHFLDSSFPELSKERAFQKETWFTSKQGALASATYFMLAWVLTAALLPTPLSIFNWVAYVALGGLFTAPIIFLVTFDFPRRMSRIYQLWLVCATWIFADILVVEMHLCGFFTFNNQCGSRNFINMLGWAYGSPVLAIFAMKQGRGYAIAGAVQWLALVGALLMTEENYPTLFYRNIVLFCFFHAFIIGTSFLKERSDRQMFALRQQLKIQYRATQSAQVMERRASDSKKRFVSYIFHEVRVPLNTALLAVQNLEGENVFKGLASDQSEMVHGLMGSLTMMEKVLNDVLSFNRMESGKFAQARKPFEFHKSIQLVALSHRMQAQMAGIELIVDLDKDIDKVGGVFVGDEMRLRQVTSNLVSNSIKFTESGSVRIVTKLLYPRFEPTPSAEIDDPLCIAAANASAQGQIHAIDEKESPSTTVDGGFGYDLEKGSVPLETRRQSRDSSRDKDRDERRRNKAVVRVEIHDTGVGLKKQDVIDNRLFSPYVQTEIGRRQGGKGSGLGLALVRQIVKLSNGRLGVESQLGKGSMFWFELPYSVPSKRKDATHLSVSLMGSPLPDRFSPPSNSIPTLPRILAPSPEDRHTDSPQAVKATDYRPPMQITESTLPLLPQAHVGQRRIPSEEIVTSTFPSTYTEGNSPVTFSPGIQRSADPFDNARPYGGPLSNASAAAKVEETPAAPPPAEGSTAMQVSPGIGDGPLCTLVVDDDKLTRMLMSRMLTRLGHQVTTAENGKIALELLTGSFEGKPGVPRFDVVFLDNQMPMMSGVEVAHHVRSMDNHIYIVGCTGNALREDQEEYLAAGADDIIPKPIHQKAVLEMIKEARKRIAGETSYTQYTPGVDDRRGSRGL